MRRWMEEIWHHAMQLENGSSSNVGMLSGARFPLSAQFPFHFPSSLFDSPFLNNIGIGKYKS